MITPPKMKLLIVTDAWHPQVNGVVRTYEHIITELEKTGHDTHVISPSDFPLTIPMPGYPEIHLALAPYKHLKRLIETQCPDYIHVATEGPLGWAGRRYCIKHNKPFSTSYHTQFPDYTAKRVAKFFPFMYGPIYKAVHKLGRHYVRSFHSPADALMVATRSLEDELKSWGFETPFFRVTRGANLEQFYPGDKMHFHDLTEPIALYVGRVAIEKNLEDFLEMEWEGSKVIIGDGPNISALSQKYPDTHFLGTKEGEELAAYFRSADLFVFPSRTDTFGMVLVEALASGLPVAAYNVTGPKDIITNNTLGALHEHDLTEAARKALNNAGNPQDRAQHVKTHYNWKKAAEQFAIAMKAERNSHKTDPPST